MGVEKQMENINIRIAEQKDINSINKLLYQVHKIHADARPDLFLQGEKKYTDEELSEIITNQSQTPVFVAEFGGVIAGYAFCQVIRTSTNNRNINTLYIDDFCVDEEYRGNHIGTILLDYVTEFARKNKFYNITLNVWALNDKAKRFYERNGMNIQKFGMEKIIKQEVE